MNQTSSLIEEQRICSSSSLAEALQSFDATTWRIQQQQHMKWPLQERKFSTPLPSSVMLRVLYFMYYCYVGQVLHNELYDSEVNGMRGALIKLKTVYVPRWDFYCLFVWFGGQKL